MSTPDLTLPEHCIICTESFDNHRHRPGIGPCEHVGICGLCHIRLRRLLGDMTCPMCKSAQDSVFIFDAIRDVCPYKMLNIWGDNAGPGVAFDDQSRVFMPRAFYKEVFQTLQSTWCKDCE